MRAIVPWILDKDKRNTKCLVTFPLFHHHLSQLQSSFQRTWTLLHTRLYVYQCCSLCKVSSAQLCFKIFSVFIRWLFLLRKKSRCSNLMLSMFAGQRGRGGGWSVDSMRNTQTHTHTHSAHFTFRNSIFDERPGTLLNFSWHANTSVSVDETRANTPEWKKKWKKNRI